MDYIRVYKDYIGYIWIIQGYAGVILGLYRVMGIVSGYTGVILGLYCYRLIGIMSGSGYVGVI